MKISAEDLDALAGEILPLYGIAPTRATVIQAGDVKTVWKIERDHGRPLCLKRLRHTMEKAVFAAGAQKYVFAHGGPVPRILATQRGDDLAARDGQLFALYEWVDGEPISLDTGRELRAALHGLAHFHRSSRGYVPPEGDRVSTKLGRWPHHYDSMRRRLIDWKGKARSTLDAQDGAEGADATEATVPFLSREYLDAYLREVDGFVTLAAEAEERLASSRYAELTVHTSQQGLCHQDFGPGNALQTSNGVIILDLDGVTFDLPARDLRKIIMKRASTRGKWDEPDIREVLSFYGEANPLSAAEQEILFIDLLYPHEFHDTVKNPFHKEKPSTAGELRRTASLARAKVDLLRTLIAQARQGRILE